MKSEAMVARQYRLQEWAAQIQDCNRRPLGVTVKEWCTNNNITKANYYYRLKCVRKAYLENVPDDNLGTEIVPVPITTSPVTLQAEGSALESAVGLELSIKGFSLQIATDTSMELLAQVLKVVSDVK